MIFGDALKDYEPIIDVVGWDESHMVWMEVSIEKLFKISPIEVHT